MAKMLQSNQKKTPKKHGSTKKTKIHSFNVLDIRQINHNTKLFRLYTVYPSSHIPNSMIHSIYL